MLLIKHDDKYYSEAYPVTTHNHLRLCYSLSKDDSEFLEDKENGFIYYLPIYKKLSIQEEEFQFISQIKQAYFQNPEIFTPLEA
jgi:hypothetical protein